MSRPRLTIGTYGDIGYQAAASGRTTAYARYRDWDGMTRVVQATAQTQKAAEVAATARLANAGRFGKRKARAEQRTATEHADTVRAQVRATWGAEPPHAAETLPAWAARQTAARAENDHDPRVLDAARAVEAVTAEGTAMVERQEQERRALEVREYGPAQARRMRNGMGGINPHRNAREAANRATAAQQEIEELRALPVTEAAMRLDTQQEAAEQDQQRAVERSQQFGSYEHGGSRHAQGTDQSERRL